MIKLMKKNSVPSRVSRGFSLIEILVVAVILVALSAVLMGRYLGGKTADGKRAPTPMSRAHDTECMSNIKQVRMGIETAKSTDPDGKNIQSLDELKFPKEVTHCSVGKMAYIYDPQTGEVHCPYPGHEKY
jgi:prepilin-type N-terminal cleavage/methylation domain-containing protein